jgi:hypothetical protein
MKQVYLGTFSLILSFLGLSRPSRDLRILLPVIFSLHRASIAEVVFTDTFEVNDSTYRYGQVFVDYRSRYGDAIPIRSRKKVGWSFGEFCCRHFVPLILIRDNISENIGGALMEECHKRGVKSAFSCPYKPQHTTGLRGGLPGEDYYYGIVRNGPFRCTCFHVALGHSMCCLHK